MRRKFTSFVLSRLVVRMRKNALFHFLSLIEDIHLSLIVLIHHRGSLLIILRINLRKYFALPYHAE